MYIIVGLGNPGKEYQNTRHNIGFDVIDRLAEEEHISVLEKKHKAIIGKGVVAGVKCILAKPVTYMNLSGESVRELIDYYKVDAEAELIVVSDDISLDVGSIRVRKKGSAGGHNGIKSVLAHVGDEHFTRVRIGIGRPLPGWSVIDHVLAPFPSEEVPKIREAIEYLLPAVETIVTEGTDLAMNKYNPRKQKKPKQTETAPEPEGETDEQSKQAGK